MRKGKTSTRCKKRELREKNEDKKGRKRKIKIIMTARERRN